MSADVRRLKEGELDDAPALLAAEGWSFSIEELERLRSIGGAVGAFDDGKLVAFLTYVDVEPLRWIGNVVVAPELRGAKLGQRIVEEALRDHERAGLYSVEKAVTLYERLGFVARGEAFAFRAESAAPKRRVTSARAMAVEDGPHVLKMDRDATGIDRYPLIAKLIEAYADNVRVVRERNRVVGFGFAKTSPDLTELGPIVATTPAAREALLDALLQIGDQPFEATVLGESLAAIRALEERGFTRRFRVVPMFKGEAPVVRAQQLVTAAGLEKS